MGLTALGNDQRHERTPVARSSELAGRIGCRALLAHAETLEARDFSVRLVPELEPSPTDDIHLLLLTKDIRRTLR